MNETQEMADKESSVVGYLTLDGFSYPVYDGDPIFADPIIAALIEREVTHEP